MELLRKELKKLTLIIEVDKISDSGLYLSKSNNITSLDNDYLNRSFRCYLDAKDKGIFVEKFTAITRNQYLNICNKLDKEIDYLDKKLESKYGKISNNGFNWASNLFK